MQGVGLLALLLGVALIFYLMFGGKGGGSAGQALQVQKQTQSFGNQVSGKDADGKIVTESIKFEAGPKGVVVSTVTAGGAFDRKYGLRAGDVIQEIGSLSAKEQATDDRTADAYLRDAYARDWPLVVQRGTDRLTLPQQAPETPGVPPVQRTTPRNQLDNILKGRPDGGIPTH